MKILLYKASSDYWYRIVNCNSIDDLYNLSKGHGIILRKNTWTDYDELMNCWEGMKKEDAEIIINLKYKAMIYDDYIE